MSISALAGKPETWTRLSAPLLFSLLKDVLEGWQLQWVQKRFAQLQDRIPALDSLAEKQGVKFIDSFDTLATILFTHQVYKNYPFAFIERKQFVELTRWLNKLTAHDLSSINLRGVTTIDQWLERLDEAAQGLPWDIRERRTVELADHAGQPGAGGFQMTLHAHFHLPFRT